MATSSSSGDLMIGTPAWKLWRMPPWAWAMSLLWAVVVTVPWVVAFSKAGPNDTVDGRTALTLLAVDGACTILTGFATSFTKWPWRRLLSVLAVGCVALALALFIVADAPQQSTDNHGAGLAVVILLPPIAVAAAALLSVGMGAGLLIRQVLRRPA
jgi:peptidoglycan/LPS O-acetylase OafA/YrhL